MTARKGGGHLARKPKLPDRAYDEIAEALEDAARELVERTRRAQGLPEHVEDPATLDALARLLDGAPTEKRR